MLNLAHNQWRLKSKQNPTKKEETKRAHEKKKGNTYSQTTGCMCRVSDRSTNIHEVVIIARWNIKKLTGQRREVERLLMGRLKDNRGDEKQDGNYRGRTEVVTSGKKLTEAHKKRHQYRVFLHLQWQDPASRTLEKRLPRQGPKRPRPTILSWINLVGAGQRKTGEQADVEQRQRSEQTNITIITHVQHRAEADEKNLLPGSKNHF